MKLILAIGMGSFIGGVGRYLLSKFVSLHFNTEFPLGTFIVNILGCLVIGIVFGLFAREQMTENWRLVLATGVVGGFTTFSAFSLESINLLRNGNITVAATYILCSVLGGLLATFLAYEIVNPN